MVSFKSLSVLLLAGTALAAPAPQRRYGGKKIVWHTVVKTAYVTVFPGQPQPTPKSSSSSTPVAVVTPEAPKPTPTTSTVIVYETPSVEMVKKTSTKASSTKVVVTPTPYPTPSSTKAVVVSTSTKAVVVSTSTKAAEPAPTGYMAIVNEWRVKMGHKPFVQNAKLEANAMDTVVSSNGQMVHKLNPGTYGQVLAPGSPDDFYHCYVGGWLCEKPNEVGLNGVCATASKGWYYTSTGHADILNDDKYTLMGCANHEGIWACDVAY